MKYAYLDKHGKWVGPLNMLKYFRGLANFDQLTDEQRAEKRWYPCTLVNESYDSRLQRRSGPVFTFDEETQTVTATYTLTDIPLETLIQRKRDEVDQRRDQELSRGVEYMFPDGDTAIVQTRDAKDERNILINHNKAFALVMSGQPDAPMQFRTQDDVLRNLTAQQMLEMTSYVGEQGQDIYSTSWQIKDEIKLLTTPLEIVHHPAWTVEEQPAEPDEPAEPEVV